MPANYRLTADWQKHRHHPSFITHRPRQPLFRMLFIHHFILSYSAQRGHPSLTIHLSNRLLISKLKIHAYYYGNTFRSSNNLVFSFLCLCPCIVYILDFLVFAAVFGVPFPLHRFFSLSFLLFSFLIDHFPVFILPVWHCCTKLHIHKRKHAPYHYQLHRTWPTTTYTYLFSFSSPLLLPPGNHSGTNAHFISSHHTIIYHIGTHSFIYSLILHKLTFNFIPLANLPVTYSVQPSFFTVYPLSSISRSVSVSSTRNCYSDRCALKDIDGERVNDPLEPFERTAAAVVLSSEPIVVMWLVVGQSRWAQLIFSRTLSWLADANKSPPIDSCARP